MLARFEKILEQAVEGSLRRVFPAELHPVQLAKAAARAMEDAQVVGVRGREVPNRYTLRLAPADLERFADYRDTLVRELSDYLAEYARDRGLRPVGEPRVELMEEASQPLGTVRAEARFADVPVAQQHELESAIEDTRQLRVLELARARPPRSSGGTGRLVLADDSGLRFAVEPAMGVVRIGRATDNDVEIADARISRYHAQLRWVNSGWLLYDLDSTNGTWLGNRRVASGEPRLVQPNAVIRLGDHALAVAAE